MENGLLEAYERPTYEQIAVNLNVDPSTGTSGKMLKRKPKYGNGVGGPPVPPDTWS